MVALPAGAQIRVRGVVADSLTRQGVGGALVSFRGDGKRAVTAGPDGAFSISSPKNRKALDIKVMGYAPMHVDLRGRSGDLNLDTLFLAPRSQQLDEVVVRPRKEKYSKKNNPAVAFMERLRASGDSLDPTRQPYFSTDEYEKLVLGMNVKDLPSDSAMRSYVDYSPVTGKPYITISLKEQRSKTLHSNQPRADKRVVEGYRSMGIDDSFDVGNMRRIYTDVLRQVDLYSNDITLMQNRFVSPLSRIGPDFYKYYLTDTVMINGEPNIELTFTPHNTESMGFTGRIYVPLTDSTMMPRKVVMQTPRNINLNYVRSLYIVQNFERDSLGNRIKTADELTVEFQLMPGTPEVYARRETRVDGYSYRPVAGEYAPYYRAEGDEHFLPGAYERSDEYWTGTRAAGMTSAQANMGGFMRHLRSNKLFYWGEKFVALMDRGYLHTSKRSYFDVGPLNTLVSFNDVEGARVRLGGMTTANLSKRWFTRFYGAYGFKDHRWKYGAELEYSFVDKEYHSREFPMHGIRLSTSYDLDQIGQHYLFTNQDNMFLSFKRHDNYLMTYRRLFSLVYTLERRSGFSIEAGFKWERQEPTPWVPFVTADGRRYGHYNASAFTLQLRYAPGETFYQSATMRRPINMDAPIILLTHEFGPKGMLGADFTLNKTELSVQKRFWFSAFGYADVIVKGSKLWSKVFYPALPWANANLSYTIQPESFALLNPMEFAVDQSVSWDLTYWMNGLIFNHIPWVSKAKLREVISFRGFWGSLTDKNNPWKQADLPQFPADSHTRLMGHKPYMEIGAGLDNVFTILRVDYVWRLTYRDGPGVDRGSIRVSLHFTF